MLSVIFLSQVKFFFLSIGFFFRPVFFVKFWFFVVFLFFILFFNISLLHFFFTLFLKKILCWRFVFFILIKSLEKNSDVNCLSKRKKSEHHSIRLVSVREAGKSQKFSAFNQFYWFPWAMPSLSWVYCLRDHWKVLNIMCREYFNPRIPTDAIDSFGIKWNFVTLEKLAEIEISFIVHLARCISSGHSVNERRVCIANTSANRVCDTVISVRTLEFNAFIAYCLSFHFISFQMKRKRVGSKKCCVQSKINNKQSKF